MTVPVTLFSDMETDSIICSSGSAKGDDSVAAASSARVDNNSTDSKGDYGSSDKRGDNNSTDAKGDNRGRRAAIEETIVKKGGLTFADIAGLVSLCIHFYLNYSPYRTCTSCNEMQ